MNVADLLTQQAAATPQVPAVIHGDRVIGYADFEALVWGLCRHLHESGLRPGDVVGLHLTDPFVHLAAVLALARSGIVSVAIAAVGGQAQAGKSLLARTGATAVIDADRRLDWGPPTWIGLDLGPLSALRAEPDASLRSDEPDRLLHYKTSSGTTGEPKIVAATHAGMIASIARETTCIGYLPGERYLTPVPLSYDGPRRRYLACLASGATAVMPPAGAAMAALIEIIDRHDVRHFSCVPSQAWELAESVPPGRQRFPQMRCLRLSAGPSDASLHRLLRERLCSNVLISYGCTELGPLAVAPPDLVASRPQTVGRAMPGVELQIVSADDLVLPADTVGLIRVRAEGMPLAYRDDPEATARFFRNGWFYPGDLGKTDAAGLLFHMGRSDGMMLVNGINIYPAEIEQAMLSHPAVRDAVAMPMQHDVAHHLPVCAVVLSDDQRVSRLELLNFARSRLGSHSPRRLVILDSIPRNEHGKVRRKALAEVIAARLDADCLERRPGGSAAARGPGDAVPGQLQLIATLVFAAPDGADLERLDAWLNGVLQLDVPAAPLTPDMQDMQDPSPCRAALSARAWLERLLLMTRLLLQAARIPVFDAPQVFSCQSDPVRKNTWQARVSFARVEAMSNVAYDLAFAGARHLNAWAMARPVTEENLQTLYGSMQQLISSDLGRMLPSGHSRLPVLREAHRRAIPFAHLGAGVFQLGWGRRARRMDRSISERDSAIGARLCGNKDVAAALLRKAGLPAPLHRVVASLAQASAAARKIGWPVVVKPVDRARGEGVFVDVGDDDALKAAFESARAQSRSQLVLVERQVDGVCHRLFMAQGRLLYAVKRSPMSVVGDGVNDVAALVDAEVARQARRPPWERSGIQPMDDIARAAITRAGFTPTSVPEPGAQVPLRRIESTAWGGVDEEVTRDIHPENLRVALAATELFGLDMAGIDIITADITRPWFDNGAIVNEVNYGPLLGGAAISRSHLPAFLHKFVDDGGKIPVEVFAGGAAAWAVATRRWQEMVASGLAACLSHAQVTLESTGQEWQMPFVGLYPRTRALVLCARVQALVLVVQSDELLISGLPLEAVDAVTVVDDRLVSAQPPGDALAPERVAATLQLLRRWRRWATVRRAQ